MSLKEKRLRHGELLTVAWNPSIKRDAYAVLSIDGEDVPLTSLRVPESTASKVVPEGAAKARFFALGDARIIASVDNTTQGRMLHISVSHKESLPSWSEMIAIKRHFFPDDVAAVMVMPEEEVYVNMHQFTLHIWQLPEKWGIG
jgi:hypothetical protein